VSPASSGRPARVGRHTVRAAGTPGAVIPPAPSTIDLHTHTRRSDGVLTPTALVAAAAEAGVQLLAITDHDTLAGYRELVAADAVPPGLELIPGVEINALVTRDLGLWEGELHILGFGMDPDDDAFEAALAAQRGERRTRFTRTIDQLREIGLPIDDQVADLVSDDDDALGRPTIARALVAAGFATSVEDAFDRIIGHGKPGPLPGGPNAPGHHERAGGRGAGRPGGPLPHVRCRHDRGRGGRRCGARPVGHRRQRLPRRPWTVR
jgi:predicted metal-dependent phosphoesterase TrpH